MCSALVGSTKLQCFLVSLKGRHLWYFELKKLEFLKETDERAYTTGNVTLTIQSARILESVKFNAKTRYNKNRYLKQISDTILPKQLHYSLSISMK